MAKLIQFPSSNEQIHNSQHQHLKLVVSNPSPFYPITPTITNSSTRSNFISKVQRKGPNLYEMSLLDTTYGLRCDPVLEIDESRESFEESSVICHYPSINGGALFEYVEDDKNLYGMLMVEFQMKVLEQLLLFCIRYNALTLIIFVDDTQAKELSIYQDFLDHVDETLSPQGEKTEMVISANRETYEKWIKFMADTTNKFKQTLWYEQNKNPIIREYLAHHSLLKA